mmetsp:Transcript_86760/g.265553  ORF Transcript_86760/g.265553 Transcript_86760/m.265553 type:complete len:394 (-) Transcript_86760:136-1317(-)
MLFRTVQSPRRRGGRVIQGREFAAFGDQLVEAVVIDPRVPRALDFEAFVRNQNDATMLVLASKLVILGQTLVRQNPFREQSDLFVPWDVAHGERGSLGLPAKCDGLDLNQVRVAQRHEPCVILGVGHVVVLDQREPIRRPLLFLRERPQRIQVPVPEVGENRSVHLLQGVRRSRVDADIQLSHWAQLLDRLGELRVRDEECADFPAVQVGQQLVDPRVHDRLSHQRKRAMPHLHRGLPALRFDAWNALALLDHLLVLLNALRNDRLRLVHLPLPLRARGVLVVTPAEDAFVGASQRWRCLHALERGDPVKRMLIAAAPAAQLVLGPAAQLDSGVRTDDFVPLLGQLLPVPFGNHFAGLSLRNQSTGAGGCPRARIGHLLDVGMPRPKFGSVSI